ncbi:putative DCC family thiol-disulfide oxidoreductase YuxK [Paenibacillus phyllosphaerae]|uniref:Putative DCC family thiol-disulfide oxidoreductase YuxK n=1 Tax=Paenibacillus phyllosphaerae TaxID=274593 RepID=A0A7W5FMM7_9BACL|nr:DCC1-like thiol-disulfide oxidoreductase family protein [Paenibacillus phyllosphaerae]MBB3110293.1 putative DCC family thiol-disulfide oxidoreductase YuxK [Paenibacillus phyllosphaerae]
MKTSSAGDSREAILLVDGECALCHWITAFVMTRDAARRFQFGSLQSPAGLQLLREYQLPLDMNTFVMIQEDRAYTKSDAALRVLRQLGGLWPLASISIIIPRALRDFVYDRVANNRYRWFGRRELCNLPAAKERGRLIDGDGGGAA